MLESKITENYSVTPAKTQSFFELSSQFKDAAPFRRILSLIRFNGECQTLVRTDITFEIGTSKGCPRRVENNRRCDSCTSYIEQMKENKHGLCLVEKTCSRLFFFACKIDETEKITKKDHGKHLLGYCVVHLDKLQELSSGRPYIRPYVPECVLRKLSKEIRGFKYGNITCEVELGGEKFEIKRGNYFSQQNALTNCCAHAAIKTALRGYDEDISCDSINNVLINDLEKVNPGVDKALEIARMARGLTPTEMLTAIEKISQGSKTMAPLAPFLVTAHDLPINSFVETIYRAIESKIPVILLLRFPENFNVTSSFGGHAVSLVGHTFNKHNWCAYGSSYFSDQTKASYLSSYLWCDNYVVQDDNFGPAYHLPCNFLADYYEYGVTIEKLGINIASQRALDSQRPNFPLAAIIIPPAHLKKHTEKLHAIERYAAERFVEQLRVFSRDKKVILTDIQKELYDRYFYYIFNCKKSNKPRVFITRTILTNKNEYLKGHAGVIYNNHYHREIKLKNMIRELLPEIFWITEISVPELYWINKAKIGEIVIDTDVDPSVDTGIRLIRLPYFVAMYPKGDINYYAAHLDNQIDCHHQIIKKKEGIIRQYKRTV